MLCLLNWVKGSAEKPLCTGCPLEIGCQKLGEADMAKESIYKYLTKMAAENPHLPYVFQNPFTAGARDVDFY